MAQVVQSWLLSSSARPLDLQAPSQASEGGFGLAASHAPAPPIDQHGGCWVVTWPEAPLVTEMMPQSIRKCWGQGNQTSLEEFGIAYREHAGLPIHIRTLQSQSFAETQTRAVKRTLPPLKTKNPLIASASSDVLLVHV